MFLMVELDTRRFGRPEVALAAEKSLGALTRRYWYQFVSLLAIVVFMVYGFSPVLSVFWATVTTYVLSFLRRDTAMGVRKLIAALKGGSQQMLNVADSRAALTCPGDPQCVPGFAFTFQSINRANVRIYGAEAKGEWAPSPNWTLAGSFPYANGEYTTLGQPLNSINPLTGVAGLRYASAGAYGDYGAAPNTAMVARKTEIATIGGLTPFATPGFATLDLTGYWNVNRSQPAPPPHKPPPPPRIVKLAPAPLERFLQPAPMASTEPAVAPVALSPPAPAPRRLRHRRPSMHRRRRRCPSRRRGSTPTTCRIRRRRIRYWLAG
jgi:hypothetical protein